MNPERWRKVEDVYHSALEKPPEERGTFLDEACGDDGGLRQEVQSLLAQTEAEPGILDHPARELLERPELRPGQELGPYRIVEAIGAGGMGRVYKALDVRLGRTVAVKISRGEFSGRFRREARAVAALNHPNICTLYDIGPNYLVMEYVEGSPIRGPLPLPKALKHAAAIAGALDAAHRKGIIHRDLKPANILLTEAGPKLLDFGLAKLDPAKGAPAAESTVLTGTVEGTIAGTMQYMSPEQLQGREADARSDIFSFGLVFFEMLTGRPAFDADNPASLIAAILKEQPDVRKHLPQVPPPVERVLQRALAKDPDDRWQTARDLKAELEWIAGSPGQPVAVPAGSKPGHGRKVWIAAGAVLAGIAILLGVMLWAAWPTTPSPKKAVPVKAVRTQPRLTWFDRAGRVLGTVGAPADYSNPAISPDGSRLAVSVRSSGNKRQVWVFDLNRSEAIQLTTADADNTNPVWSPDGSQVAYCSDRQGHRDVYARLADGTGAERVLLLSEQNKNPLDWSRDGRLFIYNVERASGVGFDLWELPMSGATRRPRQFLASAMRHDWAELSPDGRYCLFRAGSYDTAGVYLRSLAANAEESVVCSAGCSEGHWRADGSEIYFMSAGVMTAQQVLRRGSSLVLGVPQQLFRPRNPATPGRNYFVVSPDGQRFLIILQ